MVSNLTVHSSVSTETSAFVSCPSTGEFMVCSILMVLSPNEEEPLTSSAVLSLASGTEETLPSKTEFVSNFPSSIPMFVLPPALLLRVHGSLPELDFDAECLPSLRRSAPEFLMKF